jgi:hypothetical protein
MESFMKTYFTNHTTDILGRWPRFIGVILMVTLMIPAIAFSQPTLNLPAQGVLNVSTGPTLSWNATAATAYRLQVSVNSDFSMPVSTFDVSAPTVSKTVLPVLANGTLYYWHVSDNVTGLSTYSTSRSFTTNPTPVNLGTAADFTILANTGITGGAGCNITGDIGVTSAASTITGFSQTMHLPDNTYSTSAFVTGKIYAFDYTSPTPTKMTTASGDMGTAYTDAANRTPVPVGAYLNVGSGEIGGLDLGPGLYKWGAPAVTISNDLTLTGNSTDVWIFQIAQTLGMANGKQIILVGGALASNVFWQVAGQVTLTGTAAMKGIILGQTGIAFGANGTLTGRALAQTNVTLITNTVNQPSVPTGVEKGSTPQIFSLLQNYPNPFNPTTAISFTLAKDGFTTLKIYDVLGREVTTLVNGVMKAGVMNTVNFNASKLSSGVYFSRLESGGNVQMKKLVLLK